MTGVQTCALPICASLPKFRVDELLKPPASGKSVSGLLNFSANLSMRGTTQLAMRQSAQGDMSLSGASLTLKGNDLDQQLQKFALSQSLNLLDVSALLFVGPISLVVSKGVELSALTKQSTASTSIRNLISRWKVEKGVARAIDVALTTNENRVAVHGDLDFVHNQYQALWSHWLTQTAAPKRARKSAARSASRSRVNRIFCCHWGRF